ncbi:hypothetical protein OAQ39_05500, partial [Alphaproteobacteria bacterium]|nr:hypothetical protein [Alphaproteobacteria bacterium]
MATLLRINIKILFFLILLYFCICFSLLSYEGGDEGYFLRIIHALINHRIFLIDFATNQPVITLYIFYIIDFFSTNLFLSGRVLVGIFYFISLSLIIYSLRNEKIIIIFLSLFFYFLAFLICEQLFNYTFQIRQWPIIYMLQIVSIVILSYIRISKRLTIYFLFGLVIGLLFSSRQNYILIYPATISAIFLYDYKCKSLNKYFLKKLFILTIGFFISSLPFLIILFLDLNFSLGLWYLLDQSSHHSHGRTIINSFFDLSLNFLGYDRYNQYISPRTILTVLLYFYLTYDFFFKKSNEFTTIVFFIASIIISSSIFSWAVFYHSEIFYLVLIYFFLSFDKHKLFKIIILICVVIFVTLFNKYENNYNLINKNFSFFKERFQKTLNFEIAKIEQYSNLNSLLNDYCEDKLQIWDPRRGLFISTNKKCNMHDKIVFENLSEIKITDIYSDYTVQKIYEITFKPNELIDYILFNVDIIITPDTEEITNKLLLIMEENDLFNVYLNVFKNNNSFLFPKNKILEYNNLY